MMVLVKAEDDPIMLNIVRRFYWQEMIDSGKSSNDNVRKIELEKLVFIQYYIQFFSRAALTISDKLAMSRT